MQGPYNTQLKPNSETETHAAIIYQPEEVEQFCEG